MELQPSFVTNIQAVYGEAGATWLQHLPLHLEELSRRWDFRFIKQFVNLTFNYVSLVEFNATHELAILKTAPKNKQLIMEARCLQCFHRSVPGIYDLDEEKNAILMEYLDPGTSLKTLVQQGQDENATRILCQVILDLQTEQERFFEFKHIEELALDLQSLKGHIDDYLISKATFLFHELSSDRSNDVLLHGDLHHDNIIQHASSWKIIDPHGYVGDPVAEVGVMIRNPMDCFPTQTSLAVVIENRLKILAEQLSFDSQRIKAWAFCMTLLSAAWNIQDFRKLANFEMAIVSAIEKVKI